MKKLLILFALILVSCSSEESVSENKDIVDYLKSVDGVWVYKRQSECGSGTVNVPMEYRDYITFKINKFLFYQNAEVLSMRDCSKNCKRLSSNGDYYEGDLTAQTENSFTWEHKPDYRFLITLSDNKKDLTIKRLVSGSNDIKYELVTYNDMNEYVNALTVCD